MLLQAEPVSGAALEPVKGLVRGLSTVVALVMRSSSSSKSQAASDPNETRLLSVLALFRWRQAPAAFMVEIRASKLRARAALVAYSTSPRLPSEQSSRTTHRLGGRTATPKMPTTWGEAPWSADSSEASRQVRRISSALISTV